MRFILIMLVVSGLMSRSLSVHAQDAVPTPEKVNIFHSPTSGTALQGIILIEGEYPLEGITNAALSFSYKDDPRDTWFPIHEVESPDVMQFSYEWDTTTLTDGDYTLRIIVIGDQHRFIDFMPDLRIRNYTAIETATPFPTSTQAEETIFIATNTPSSTESPVPIPATSLPTNPAQISTGEIGSSMGRGALIATSLLALFGFYHYLRNRRKRN